jgi:hypothetical protein
MSGCCSSAASRQPTITNPAPTMVAPQPSESVAPVSFQPGTQVSGSAPVVAAPHAAAGGWNPQWEQRFRALELAPADLAYLRDAGLDDAQLHTIATELSVQPALDPARTATRAVSPVTAGPSSAWNSSWESKFRTLLTRAGLSQAEIQSQLAAMRDQPVTAEQLEAAHTEMSTMLGAWSQQWAAKFRDLFGKANMSEAQITQALQSMAASGLDEAALKQAYDQGVHELGTASALAQPGWNSQWENKFKTLGLPQEIFDQIRTSGAPASFLSSTFQTLLKTKVEFRNNGRLKRLEDAGADSMEKWGVMIEAADTGGFKMRQISDKDFSKQVDAIKSSNVPAWKRVASIALNFIPGVGALQFATGKDWITGEKIDRSNPLNIAGAVLSAVAVVPMAGAISGGIRGATSLGRVASVAGGGAAGVNAAKTGAVAVNVAKNLGTTEKAASSLLRLATPMAELSAADKFRKAFDLTKMALPGISRFGTTGKVMQLGRGYTQTQALANTFSRQIDKLDDVVGGNRMKAFVLQADDTANMSRALSADEIATITKTTGMTPDEIIKLRKSITPALNGESAILRQGGSLWRFNPTTNQATVNTVGGGGRLARTFGSTGSNAEGFILGRGINSMGRSTMNTADFANVASKLTGTELAELGTRLGVAEGSRFRALAQIRRAILPGSQQQYLGSVSRANHAGSDLYAYGARARGAINRTVLAPALAMTGAGLVSGQLRAPSQAMWEMWQQRDEIAAAEQAERARIEREYAEESAALDQAWAEYQSEQNTAVPTAG